MEEKYQQYKEELLNDRNFIYYARTSKSDTSRKVEDQISSLAVSTRVALPFLVIGYSLAMGNDSDNPFWKTLLFIIATAALIISYLSYQTANSKLVDYTFYYKDLPQKVEEKARNSRNQAHNTTLSELQSVTDHSISLIEAIRYRKSIPKELWDDLYLSLLKAKKLQKAYRDTETTFDYVERELPKDFVFISNLYDKCK